MSSKTQLNEYIKILRKTIQELTQTNEKLTNDLDWANAQIGMVTNKLKQYRKRSWWDKLINKY